MMTNVVNLILEQTLAMEATVNQEKPIVERRQLPRLPFTKPVQYRSLFKAPRVYTGSIAGDLSASGLRITNAVPLSKEDRLVLLFSLPDSAQTIRTIARVACQRERPFEAGYESGQQFIEITPEDRDSIAGYVERGVVS